MTRWCEIAREEGASVDGAMQARLCMMETVAAKAGRELGKQSVLTLTLTLTFALTLAVALALTWTQASRASARS